MKDYAPLIERAFSLEPREQSYVISNIEGHIPDFIRGTYYLNGPARFARAGLRYRNWLDGDGMVCALRFERGRVQFVNRFVGSAKLKVEEEAKRPVFRTFGTAFAGDRLKRRIALESPVNVSVYPYQNLLLAFGEQGLPWELDPVTLETRGEFTFHGSLNDISPFAAHPKFDHTTGEMFNFGIAFSATNPLLNFYRFDARGQLLLRQRLALDYACSMHDFGISRNYAAFYLSPYLLDMEALALEGRTLMDSLRWEPERGSQLLVVARETGAKIVQIPIGSRYCLHFINCFEEGNRLNVDLLELERPIYDQYQTVPNLFTNICTGQPVRLVINLDTLELVERREIGYRLAPDFPTLDPYRLAQPYSDFWMLGISSTGQPGRKFFDQLVHASWASTHLDIYQPPAGTYLGGEPIFVGALDEESGVVICQMFDAEREINSFAIFDAFAVAGGPVALLHLREPIPLGFHASFRHETQDA